MRYFYFVLLSILMASCQPSKPSEMELYQTAKTKNHLQLEQTFNSLVAQTIETTNNRPLSSKTYVNSPTALAELKEAIKGLKKTSESSTEKTTKEDIITPSTSKTDVDQLDSITKTITSDVANGKDKTKNGAMLLNVRNYQDTYTKINQLATKYDFNIASEAEHTSEYHKGNTMEIYANPENFEQLIKEFRNLALIIRKKQIWQQEDNQDFLRLKSQIATSNEAIAQLNEQLAAATTIEDKLSIQEKITSNTQELDLLVLNATKSISNKPFSAITVSFYQELDMAKPAPENFNADFSSNLITGWENFKQFLLEAALVWPYIILGLIFLITAMLAVSNSRKKAQQFKLQLLHGQNLQQQIAQQNIKN